MKRVTAITTANWRPLRALAGLLLLLSLNVLPFIHNHPDNTVPQSHTETVLKLKCPTCEFLSDNHHQLFYTSPGFQLTAPVQLLHQLNPAVQFTYFPSALNSFPTRGPPANS